MTAPMSGRVVLITGATGGIGTATARAFAARGADVVLNHLGCGPAADVLAAELSEHGGEVLVHEADVGDWEAVGAMTGALRERFGRLDVLVNNAGLMEEQRFAEISLVDWNRTIGVDLTGVFVCARQVLGLMSGGGGGAIVNVASQLAFKGAAGYAAYCAAKAGVVGLTRAMARELGPGVRVNAVAPGPVASPMTAPWHTPEWLAERTGPLVIGRLAEPAEVADAIVFLASDAAALMHGQTLHANGGGVME